VTGGRTFNFNYDGLAHIGLVPDLLADIRKGPGKDWGMTGAEMAPIFKSAEAYIRMWERIQASERRAAAGHHGRCRGDAGAERVVHV